MKSPLLLIILTLIIQLYSFGQSDYRQGYVIKTNGDSISGILAFSGDHKNQYCYYKGNKDAQPIKYAANDIFAYGFNDDKRFESKFLEHDSTSQFLEILVRGKMHLYRLHDTFYIEIATRFLRLPPDEENLINTERGQLMKRNTKYIGILNVYLSECQMNANKIDYTERQLVKVVREYNQCKGGESILYKQKKPWTKLTYRLFTGIDISKLHMNPDQYAVPHPGGEYTFFNSYSSLVGVGVDISSPRINEKIALTLEFFYTQKKYVGDSKIRYGSQVTDQYEDHINISFVKFPIGFKYSFLKEQNTPYVKGGFVHYYNVKSSYSYIHDRVASQIVYTDYQQKPLMTRNQGGIWFSLGYSCTLVNRFRSFVEVRYERTNGFIGQGVLIWSSTNNISVLVGIRF